jgi:hypothetical protein
VRDADDVAARHFHGLPADTAPIILAGIRDLLIARAGGPCPLSDNSYGSAE